MYAKQELHFLSRVSHLEQMDVLQKLHIDLDAVHQIDLPGLVMMAYAIAVLEDTA